jgi:hypothetical protein
MSDGTSHADLSIDEIEQLLFGGHIPKHGRSHRYPTPASANLAPHLVSDHRHHHNHFHPSLEMCSAGG